MNRTGIKDRIQYNVTGQTLSFEAPQGRPSADGTVSLYDSRHDPDDATYNPIVTGTATRTAIDVVTNGAAGPAESDPRNVPILAATITGLGTLLKPGICLWLTNASQESERIEVAKVGTSSIGSVEKLSYSYATGASVKSAEMTSPAIPAAWIQDEINLCEDAYAVWTYTVGGVTYRSRSYFDVVREIVDNSIRDLDLLDGFPELGRLLNAKERAGYIRAAQTDVDMLFRLRGYSPNRVRGTEAYTWLIKKLIPLKAAQTGKKPGGIDHVTFLQAMTAEWEQAESQFLEGRLAVPYDAVEDDVIASEERDAFAVDLLR